MERINRGVYLKSRLVSIITILFSAILLVASVGGCTKRDFSGDSVKWTFTGDGTWDGNSRKWTVDLAPGDNLAASISLLNTGTVPITVHIVAVVPADTIGVLLDKGSNYKLDTGQSTNTTLSATAYDMAAKGSHRYVIDFGSSFNETAASSPIASGPASTKINVTSLDNVTSVSQIWHEFGSEELILTADIVLLGEVKDILPAEWGPSYEHSSNVIHTDVLVEVRRWLSNAPSTELIAIRMYSGKVGNDVRIEEESPVLTVGDQAAFFLDNLNKYGEVSTSYRPEITRYLLVGGPQAIRKYNDSGVDINGHVYSYEDISNLAASK
jgi:hypothetical protein